ncbi:MAG: acyl transferase [Crocinitomicaceae bacterium]|nr:acyl transferase [Crocinitomicaceae bacterium]
MIRSEFIKEIFSIRSRAGFDSLAMDLFHYQSVHCTLYRNYLSAIKIAPADIKNIAEIPFLPIDFFKNHRIMTGDFESSVVFTSSGTTQSTPSRHFVRDTTLYETSFITAFEQFLGPANDLCILALLPSYLERKGSSLVYMADVLIQRSTHPLSGFFLHRYEDVAEQLRKLEKARQRTLLLGVTFALLDLADQYPASLRHTIIMETGGMKGRKTEITRDEVHGVLKTAFGVPTIYSEYGMTELLSQAYSASDGIFQCPPWMQVFIRETSDPLSPAKSGAVGGINIVDLANIDSCAFIATQDLGKLISGNRFEVIGRFDYADVRGCNLLSI